MDHLYQNVYYLKGLAEGLDIEESSKEGKLLLHMIDVLEDFADVIDEMNEKIDDVDEYVDYMDEDLSDVEEEVFGYYDDEDDYVYDNGFFDDTDDDECPEGECECKGLDDFEE